MKITKKDIKKLNEALKQWVKLTEGKEDQEDLEMIQATSFNNLIKFFKENDVRIEIRADLYNDVYIWATKELNTGVSFVIGFVVRFGLITMNRFEVRISMFTGTMNKEFRDKTFKLKNLKNMEIKTVPDDAKQVIIDTLVDYIPHLKALKVKKNMFNPSFDRSKVFDDVEKSTELITKAVNKTTISTQYNNEKAKDLIKKANLDSLIKYANEIDDGTTWSLYREIYRTTGPAHEEDFDGYSDKLTLADVVSILFSYKLLKYPMSNREDVDRLAKSNGVKFISGRYETTITKNKK